MSLVGQIVGGEDVHAALISNCQQKYPSIVYCVVFPINNAVNVLSNETRSIVVR